MSDRPPTLPGVSHVDVDAGGLRMHVALAGPTDAPPLLLVHGWPQSWWAWRGLIPTLADRFRVIAPDLRGHGWSEAPTTGYEKEQLASDLLALLDALEVERTIWIGHDWGAWSGYLAALRAPERIERLLALCVPHLWVPFHPRSLAMLGYQVPLSAPGIGPRVADRVARRILEVGRGGQRLAAEDVALFADHIPSRVTVAMYRTFLTSEVIPLVRGRYESSRLRVPSTVMIGSRDLVTRGIAEGPVDGQPELSVEVVDGVGHWLPEQRPEAILDWVASGSASS
ncbi:MAG TPA: alpha/beta hydrolase [Solirubrobacteraceae bacterium]|nr:alpha/beta hydrolase [Solirubrobacteraceae bacterium]